MIGKSVKQYRIEKMIGQGGMAAVYEAADLDLNRRIAIKLMHPHLAVEPSFRILFMREARLAASLDHPNIIRVYDFDTAGDDLYIVMELVSGGNLRQYVKRLYEEAAFVDYPEAIEILQQLASAVHYAHTRGMVHRDLKPDNVLLKPLPEQTAGLPYRPVLTDFGLASLTVAGEEAATQQQPIGTYPYMSPEQVNAQAVDHRTDIYALGVMLYELSVGRLPFNPRTIAEAARMHGREAVPLPTSLRRGFPPELEQIIVRCLAKDPAERYETAQQLVHDLAALNRLTEGHPAEKAARSAAELPTEPPEDQLQTAVQTPVITEAVPAQMHTMQVPVRRPEEQGFDFLTLYTGSGKASLFRLSPDKAVFTIGRDADQDIVVDEFGISRSHARLERKPNGVYYVLDPGSTNGTFVDGVQITPNTSVIVRNDSVIRIGNCRMRLLPKMEVKAPKVEDEEASRTDLELDMLVGGVKTQVMGIPPADAVPKMEPPRLSPTQLRSDRLIVYREGQPPRVILLEKQRVAIGRAMRSDIMLDSPPVSRRHALLDKGEDGFWYIRDLNSTNGVWFDFERLPANQRTRLNANRIIRIGDQWIVFEAGRTVNVGAVLSALEEDRSLELRVRRERAKEPDIDDTSDTVVMVKPLDEQVPHYSEPPLTEEMRAADRLVFYSEDFPLQVIKLDKLVMTVGRGTSQDIRLRGRRVSREHAIIEVRQDGNIYITDLDSTNGVWIGDTLLVPGTQVMWQRSEPVRIGNYWMKFERGSGKLVILSQGGADTRRMASRTIGNYRVEQFVGSSARSSVYQAVDVQLEREVALRILDPRQAAEPVTQQRFLEEARLLSRLDHPNVIKVLSYNNIENELFMVMELITGGNLRGLLVRLQDQGRLMDVQQAVDMVRQLASGLHYAHQQGLLHRDIRPDNIVLKVTSVIGPIMEYQPVLTDFTLARFAESDIYYDDTAREAAYPYISPEEAQGNRTDTRSDIYELGITAYELLIGHPPFQPRSLAEAVRVHTREAVPKLSEQRPDIPLEIEAAVLKALEKNPDNRYQTAIDMARALERALALSSGATGSAVGADRVGDDIPTVVMEQMLPREMPPLTQPPMPEGEIRYDRIIFYSENHPTQVINVNKPVLMVGRAREQDIALPSARVSRRHARVERGRDGTYRIMDLGSVNGSWLGSYRLIENVVEIWDPSETVRIGDYWLRIETVGQMVSKQTINQPQQPTPTEEAPPENGRTARPVIQHPRPRHDDIGVTVSSTTIFVAPGSSATLAVEVTNQSDFVDHFRVEAVGLPAEWVTQPTGTLDLLPGHRETTSLTFHPPLLSTSSAGSHAFEVRVSAQAKGINAVRTQVALVIAPFYGFTTELYPQRLRNRGTVELTVKNNGNTFTSFNVLARDREQAVRFKQEGKQYSLPPGHAEIIPLVLEPRQRPLFGQMQSHLFEVVVSPVEEETAGGAQTEAGDLVVTPRFTRWMLVFAILLLLLCVGVAVFALFQTRLLDDIRATATAIAFATDTFATQTAVATTDPDGDGLPNYIEATLVTFADLRDTDEDGLTDGEEFRAWGTNPLNRDTDGDTISDGEEVAQGTDPNNRDTDGDGIQDNVDPMPVALPTATPTPFPTVSGTTGDICPGSPIPARLAVGMRASVTPGGLPNRLRAEPGFTAEVLGTIPPGAAFQVIGGPTCDDTKQARWWQVNYNGLEGWTVEGEGEEYYLAPPEGSDGGGGGGVNDSGSETSLNLQDVAGGLPSANSVELERAQMGVQMFTQITDAEWDKALASADSLDLGWIKVQANWRFLQPAGPTLDGEAMQTFMAHLMQAKAGGYNVLVSIAKAPDWARSADGEDGPPDDPEDLAEFITDLLEASGDNIDAIEIWNEPNLRREWTGELDFSGEGYMQLFDPAYEAVRAVSPDIIVVTAGLSPATDTDTSLNDREFLRQMYREGLANYENIAVGAHPYGWGNPPDLLCCDPRAEFGWDEQPQFFFLNTLVDYRNIMLRFDDEDAALWVTEFGWSSWTDLGTAPPEPWMAYLSPEAQAQSIARAFEIGQGLDFVGPMFLWNFNFANDPLIANRSEVVGFSLTRTDSGGNLNIRPVFQLLLNLLG